MNNLLVLLTTLSLTLTSCASGPTTKPTPRPELEGVCMHPAVQGGNLFPVDAFTHVENGILFVSQDGEELQLLGSVCIMREKKSVTPAQ